MTDPDAPATIAEIREWLDDTDANIDNPYDTRICNAIRTLLADHADDFVWEQWAVQIHFPGGLTSVDHDTEDEARSHQRQLLAKPVKDRRVEVVRRVNIQGTWRVADDEDET